MKEHAEEYIGATVEVVESPNETLRGLRGRILDETKYTFTVEVNGQEKHIMKKGNTFRIGGKIVQGTLIAKRPEERLKLR